MNLDLLIGGCFTVAVVLTVCAVRDNPRWRARLRRFARLCWEHPNEDVFDLWRESGR